MIWKPATCTIGN